MASERIFLSHSSDDKELAEALYNLLKAARFNTPDVGVFYDQESLKSGDRFTDRILDQLKVARAVVALVTPGARRRPSVLAEMAIGLAEQKLRPVAVPSAYRRDTTWPFDLIQYSEADKANRVEEFLTALAQEVGHPLTITADIRAACDSFAAKAASPRYQPPDERLQTAVKWGALATVVFVACALTAVVVSYRVRASIQPVQLVVTHGQDQEFSAIRLRYSGTFPARILTRRLMEMHKKIADGDQTVYSPSSTIFSLALAEARKYGRFHVGNDHATKFNEIPRRWNGEAGTQQPGENGDCALTETIDADWCASIRSMGDQKWKTNFDNTEFAIVQTRTDSKWGDRFPVAVGSLVSVAGVTFRVQNIGRMSEEGVGGILHLQEHKD